MMTHYPSQTAGGDRPAVYIAPFQSFTADHFTAPWHFTSQTSPSSVLTLPDKPAALPKAEARSKEMQRVRRNVFGPKQARWA